MFSESDFSVITPYFLNSIYKKLFTEIADTFLALWVRKLGGGGGKFFFCFHCWVLRSVLNPPLLFFLNFKSFFFFKIFFQLIPFFFSPVWSVEWGGGGGNIFFDLHVWLSRRDSNAPI